MAVVLPLSEYQCEPSAYTCSQQPLQLFFFFKFLFYLPCFFSKLLNYVNYFFLQRSTAVSGDPDCAHCCFVPVLYSLWPVWEGRELKPVEQGYAVQQFQGKKSSQWGHEAVCFFQSCTKYACSRTEALILFIFLFLFFFWWGKWG